MRLATLHETDEDRLVVQVGDLWLDLARWSHLHPGSLLPSEMVAFIRLGPAGLERARELVKIFEGKRASQDVNQLAESGVATPVARALLSAPIPRPAKNIMCLGLNYVRHALESARAKGVPEDQAVPKHPLYFTKSPTAVIGPDQPVPYVRGLMAKLDWEVELAFVIGKRGRDIPAEHALEYVFGYTVINDLSVRDLQMRSGQLWHGKSLDGLCPMGPVILVPDGPFDPHKLRVRTRVNGVTKQDSTTADFIFNIPTVLADLTRGLTLEPGDVLSTGTPEGVGFARQPPEFLKPGDVVEVEVEGIGVLRNPIVAIEELASGARTGSAAAATA
jgi:2-keto-4-pentenoate hydratase/2-oxohepta-3-ene-1,7-dioic acid hydratase in catechol pathway